MTPETAAFLKGLRSKITLGVVGGSDFPKQKEQLGETGAWFVFGVLGGWILDVGVCGCMYLLILYCVFYIKDLWLDLTVARERSR